MAMKRVGTKRKNNTKLSPRTVLHRYFERKKDQSASEFLKEVKALTDDERLELAQEAACMMKLTQSEVQFDLK